jgi:hypothetical protein
MKTKTTHDKREKESIEIIKEKWLTSKRIELYFLLLVAFTLGLVSGLILQKK